MALVTSVNPLRVRTLLLSALSLFSKGTDDGKFWVQGVEKTSSPVLGNHYGYCSIGAINNVPGFSEEEKRAARIALAKIIDNDFYGGSYVSDYHDGYSDDKLTFENSPHLADDLIAEVNDDEETEFSTVRSWFNAAAALVKR